MKEEKSQSQQSNRIQALESRVRELTFLHQTSRLLTATLDLTSVLRSLMAQVRDYFQVEAVSVALLDEEAGDLVFRVAVGGGSREIVGLRMARDQGIAGWVLQTGEPVLVPDVYADPRHYTEADEETGFRTRTMLAVPIKADDQPIGVIEALNPTAGTFGEGEFRLLCEVADRAAVAIRNAELYERARQAERRYESLFDGSPVPVIVMDLGGNVLDLNQQAAELLERPRDRVIGLSSHDLFGEQLALDQEDLLQLPEDNSWSVKMEIPCQDGMHFLEAHMTAIDYGGREAIQWIGHDVTEQVKLEQMRDDLMHMIIHDLRNPLGNILGSLQMIHTAFAEKDDTLPVMDVLRVAVRSSKKLSRLIDSLLDLRQLEAGRAELDKVLVPPGLPVQEALGLIEPLVEKKDQELVLEIAPRLPQVRIDRDMMTRVLMNLLDNAAKFTPTKGEIGLSVEQRGDELLFVVSDTGPGIPPEHRQRIFDRFTRLASARGVKGTGLGLPFCKLAVEAHGGQIWVESEVDKGSKFKFSLPLEDQ